MKRRPIRPLVLACATLAVSALGTAAVDYTNLLARTDSFLSAFGLDPSEPIVRRPYRNPIPEFPQLFTNSDAVVLLQCRIAGWPGWPQMPDDAYPLKIRVFVQEPGRPAVNVGNAFLFASETNSLATVFSPVMDTTMGDESVIRRWHRASVAEGFRFVGYPGFGQTNGIPDHVYRTKDGVACFLRSKTTTNLCELADFVCDALSERFFAEE